MKKFTFKTKIMLMLATSIVALLVVLTLTILQERKLIIESRKETLQTAVQGAHSIVDAYKRRADAGV